MLLEHSIVCPVLVGRSASLAMLAGTLERARAGEGTTVLVNGEAGIGKSRLLRAAVAEARRAGFLVLQGSSFEADRALPFAPFLDLVRAFGAATSPAVAAHALAPAACELLGLFPELQWVFVDGHPSPATDPEHGRRRLFHAIQVAFQQLAKQQPLLLVFEDVHWSDDATLDLLRHLAHGVTGQRTVDALTYRSDEVGPRLSGLLSELDRARPGAELRLTRLGSDDVDGMLRAIFGADAALGPEFTRAVHDLTEGNPFFVEELLKALVVAGDVARTMDGQWHARRLERVRVPRSAADAVRGRLSGLRSRPNVAITSSRAL